MPGASGTVRVQSRGRIAASCEDAFVLLSDLDRHRLLTDAGIAILSLEGPPGARRGGTVELRGPAGLRRRARTEVQGAQHPRRLWGVATSDTGSVASLEWLLSPAGDGATVEARLHVTPRHWRDRLLLSLGGRWWLKGRLHAAIGRLGAIYATGPR